MLKKIATSIVVLPLVFSFAACGGEESAKTPTAPVTVTETAEPTPEPDTSRSFSDEDFADLVRSETSSFDGDTTEDIVNAAESVCMLWDTGASMEKMIETVANSGVDMYDGGFLVGAANEAYCPE